MVEQLSASGERADILPLRRPPRIARLVELGCLRPRRLELVRGGLALHPRPRLQAASTYKLVTPDA